MWELETIDKLRKQLAIYRSVKGYTETALIVAIDEIEDSIESNDEHIAEILRDRKDALQKALEFIQQDCE